MRTKLLRLLQRYAVWIFTALSAGAFGVAANLGEALTPTRVGGAPGWNPLVIVLRLVKGTMVWAPAATVLVIVFSAALITGLVAISRYTPGEGPRPKELAERLGKGDDLAPLKEKASAKDARQLHPDCPGLAPGQLIGRSVADGALLYQGWRSTGLVVIPPGGGKTSRLVIPRMAAAPGPALMTGNKVDGVAEAIAARHSLGRIWLFDPNRIYRPETEPAFTFDLSRTVTDTVSAQELAQVVIVAAKKNNPSADEGRDDAHFGPAGETCLAWFLLAAASAGEPAFSVHEWAAKGELEKVAAILDRAGHEPQAMEVRGFDRWPDKTRGSLLATIQRMCRDMGHTPFRAWTTPTPGIPEFDPAAFLGSRDTLILLSERRPGGTGAVISAMLKAIVEAAKRQAPGESRLRVPLVGELDEVANIAPWPTLPEDSSHFGSRGLCFTTYLQAYSQGVQEWGQARMKTLWQTSGVRLVGANEEDDFTQGLSRIIGSYEKTLGERQGSRTMAKAGVDDFANLPKFHAVLLTPATPATVVRLQGWYEDKELRKRVEDGKAAQAQAHRAAAVAAKNETETEKEPA